MMDGEAVRASERDSEETVSRRIVDVWEKHGIDEDGRCFVDGDELVDADATERRRKLKALGAAAPSAAAAAVAPLRPQGDSSRNHRSTSDAGTVNLNRRKSWHTIEKESARALASSLTRICRMAMRGMAKLLIVERGLHAMLVLWL